MGELKTNNVNVYLISVRFTVKSASRSQFRFSIRVPDRQKPFQAERGLLRPAGPSAPGPP